MWLFDWTFYIYLTLYILAFVPRVISFVNLTHFSPVLLFYTPWKHQKTFRFFDVFRGNRKVTPGCNGLSCNLQTLANHFPYFLYSCILHVLMYQVMLKIHCFSLEQIVFHGFAVYFLCTVFDHLAFFPTPFKFILRTTKFVSFTASLPLSKYSLCLFQYNSERTLTQNLNFKFKTQL